MKAYLAISVFAGSLVLGGCATTPPQASTAAAPKASTAQALPKEDPEYYTGSRIPNKPARDRMVKQVEGGSYTREQMNSTMSQPDPQ